MPALPKLSDVYLGNFALENGSLGTRGCGWRVPVGQIMTDNHNYQTFSDMIDSSPFNHNLNTKKSICDRIDCACLIFYYEVDLVPKGVSSSNLFAALVCF